MSDLRFAFRQLLQSRGFTLIAALTLSLGIGANTAIFSVINAVLLAPLPYPDAGRIMTLYEAAPDAPSVTIAFPDYVDWRRDNTVFESLAISRSDSRNLSGIPGRSPERVGTANVTASFFKVIGLAPTLGRTFSEEEDRVGGPGLAVISERLWGRAFNRDPQVLGKPITLHDQTYTLIGVMPAAMNSPQDTDIWIPLIRRSNNDAWLNRANHPMLFGWGRLKPGVSLGEARAEMKTIAARLEKQYPATNAGVTAVVTSLRDSLVGEYRTNLALLLGAVSLVLLIACANVANLFAVRGAARAREFAIRFAIGASRGQLIRQLLLESLLVAILGGVGGFLLALWGRDALTTLGPQGVERFQQFPFDVRVLGFTFLLSCLTTLLFGLWPAWRASKTDVQLALKSGAQTSFDSRAAARTRDALVIAEVALTLVLLVSASLVLKSFARVQSLALGYEPHGVLSARIDLPYVRYDEQKVVTFSKGLLEQVRALPGVKSAAISSNPPLSVAWQVSFSREGENLTAAQKPDADTEVVAGDYFSTLKIPLLRGRLFNDRDTNQSPLVAIIDQTMAEKYFPGQDPIGRRLLMAPFNEGDAQNFTASTIPRPGRWFISRKLNPRDRVSFYSLGEGLPFRRWKIPFARSLPGWIRRSRSLKCE
jgi:putative ABC transport system permease protein